MLAVVHPAVLGQRLGGQGGNRLRAEHAAVRQIGVELAPGTKLIALGRVTEVVVHRAEKVVVKELLAVDFDARGFEHGRHHLLALLTIGVLGLQEIQVVVVADVLHHRLRAWIGLALTFVRLNLYAGGHHRVVLGLRFIDERPVGLLDGGVVGLVGRGTIGVGDALGAGLVHQGVSAVWAEQDSGVLGVLLGDVARCLVALSALFHDRHESGASNSGVAGAEIKVGPWLGLAHDVGDADLLHGLIEEV